MNVSPCRSRHLQGILQCLDGVLVVTQLLVNFGKAVPGIHAVRIQLQGPLKILLGQGPVSTFQVTFCQGKMYVVRLYPKFNGTVIRCNGLPHITIQVVKIAHKHPGLFKSGQKFHGTLIGHQCHLLAVQLDHGISQVEPGERFVTALVNSGTVKRHRLLEFSLVVEFVGLEKIILGRM